LIFRIFSGVLQTANPPRRPALNPFVHRQLIDLRAEHEEVKFELPGNVMLRAGRAWTKAIDPSVQSNEGPSARHSSICPELSTHRLPT
jgi:hypothetical protein